MTVTFNWEARACTHLSRNTKAGINYSFLCQTSKCKLKREKSVVMLQLFVKFRFDPTVCLG